MRPKFVLLDEPAGGLTEAEIERLGAVIGVIRDSGVGVLLVEHHTDFVFRTCDRVTAPNLGRMIAHDSTTVVRSVAADHTHLGGGEVLGGVACKFRLRKQQVVHGTSLSVGETNSSLCSVAMAPARAQPMRSLA
jgi:ABC-type sugar transport system ATPase subunit